MKSATITKKVKKEAALNSFSCEFEAKSANEAFARFVCSSFASQLDPTVDELTDIKTAVSEAVTNCIVHAYRDREKYRKAKIMLSGAYYSDGRIRFTVRDRGCGIEDIKKAMQPLYTTDAQGERSGMGFTIIASFSDKLRVTSGVGRGTTVTFEKHIKLG